MGELLAEVLAVFAVHTNLNSDSDVVVIDEGKKLLIQNTFWSMHQITSEIETVTTTPERPRTNRPGAGHRAYTAHHGQQQKCSRAG